MRWQFPRTAWSISTRPDVIEKLNKSKYFFFIHYPSQKYWNICWNNGKKQITVGMPMYSSKPSLATVHAVATMKNCNLPHAADVSMLGFERARYWSSPLCTGVSSQEMPACPQKLKDRTILSLNTSLNTSPCCKRLPIQKDDKSWKPFPADERNATIAAAALASARFEAGLTCSKSGKGFLLSSSMTLRSCFVANPATWSRVEESSQTMDILQHKHLTISKQCWLWKTLSWFFEGCSIEGLQRVGYRGKTPDVTTSWKCCSFCSRPVRQQGTQLRPLLAIKPSPQTSVQMEFFGGQTLEGIFVAPFGVSSMSKIIFDHLLCATQGVPQTMAMTMDGWKVPLMLSCMLPQFLGNKKQTPTTKPRSHFVFVPLTLTFLDCMPPVKTYESKQ